MSTPFQYVCDTYGVPACFGRRVVVGGKPGIIVKDCGHYIGVNLDSDKPGVISNCHPTSDVVYGEIGKPRRLTRAQQRYRDYLEVSECFENFLSYCLYRAEKDWHERRGLSYR